MTVNWQYVCHSGAKICGRNLLIIVVSRLAGLTLFGFRLQLHNNTGMTEGSGWCSLRSVGMTEIYFFLSSSQSLSWSLLNFFGITIWGIRYISHFLLNIHQAQNPFQLILIISHIWVHLGIFTFIFHSGWLTCTSQPRTISNKVTSTLLYRFSHLLS